MSNTSYYLYQKYVKYGSQDWIPVYPVEYAISGDTGQDPVIKSSADTNCGYCPPEYRWKAAPIGEEYICSGGNKYFIEYYQVSNDCGFNWENVVPESARTGNLYESGSSDCIEYRWVNMDISTDYICDDCPDVEYRWVSTTGYVCSGTNKMAKEIKQFSYDSGATWHNVVPEESRAALPVIEYNSEDCGYVPYDYSTQYLTFVPTSGSSTFKFSAYDIDYSLDSGSTWTKLSRNTSSPSVSVGSKIMLKATLTTSSGGIGMFSSTGQFKAEGNVMSLLYGDNFSGQTSLSGKTGAFSNLFSGCTGMTSAENLILPATTLSSSCYFGLFKGCSSLIAVPSLPSTKMESQCYQEMFRGCTSLTTVPSDMLSATTLAQYCYSYMFSGCTSLTTAPELPATTLAINCYYAMFNGCSGLTESPILPAKTLTNYCYRSMFENCTSLTRITCLATDRSATDCTSYWVRNVSPTGTFVKDANTTWGSSGTSSAPSGWTIINYIP